VDPDKDGPTWLVFSITGFLLSIACLAFVVLPLRALVCRCVPHSTPLFQASVVAAFLLLFVGAFDLSLPSAGISMTRLAFAAFWAAYAITIAATFFWPLDGHNHDPAR
jgi:hypothetical protein